MNESILDFVRNRLGATVRERKAQCEAAGVPWKTVEKIARGETENPRVQTVEKLAKYFRAAGSDQAA